MGDLAVTQALLRWRQGDEAALDELVEMVYPELRRIARGRLRRETPGSLDSGALVHEAYLRLVDGASIDWQGRGHFYAIAGRVMRRVLVERARARNRHKRRGIHVSLREDLASNEEGMDVLAMDEALDKMEKAGLTRECQVVQLRFFAGLTIDDVARELGVSTPTARRAWTLAKSWLYRELTKPTAAP
ncbi:MAG: ECF-type sigma factor [Acidobacteriota bacterium]